jgi:hypothetical protein
MNWTTIFVVISAVVFIKVVIRNSHPILNTSIVYKHIQVLDFLKPNYRVHFFLLQQINRRLLYYRWKFVRCFLQVSLRLPQIITLFPSLRNLSVKTRPIPLAPPVIKIVLPVSVIFIKF